MKNRQILKNFYFYLRIKSRQIKEQVTEKDSVEGKTFRRRLRSFLVKAGKAALLSFLIYELFFYLNMGRLLLLEEFLDVRLLQAEIALAFLFIFSIFLVFPLISKFVNKRLSHQKPFLKVMNEILLVFVVNTILLSLINFAPLVLFFPELEPSPARLRTSYLVTGMVTLFFYFFVEREKSKKRLQEDMLKSARLQKENFQAQLEGLKNQVNPHFLFNSLNVLSSLIHQDSSRAVEFTRRLGHIYRSFMENNTSHLISLEKELEVAKAYIYLLETRFGAAVNFEINIPSTQLALKIPTGCLQLLIENTIKHNGSTRKKPLKVEIFTEDNFLVVKNTLQPRLENVQSTHTGLNNIKSRYRYLSEETAIFTKTEFHFIAKIPLLNTYAHEDLDN